MHDGAAKGGPAAECAAGDRSVGEQLVEASRSARLGDDPRDWKSVRADLVDACEAGCAPTCLELANTSFERDAAESWAGKACELGDSVGCSRSAELDLEAAASSCDAGQMPACATALRLAVADEDDSEDQALEQRVELASARACKQLDARACSIHAWTRCAGLEQCDGEALESASLAARLLPELELVELLANLHCHAGAAEAADAELARACEAGLTDACDRRCVELPGALVLVRGAERERYDRVATFMLLQLDATPSWSLALSAMNGEELEGFEQILEAFTPPISEPAAKVEIPDGLREQFPALVESIVRSPNLDEKKIRYWFSRLPDMTEEQRTNLLDSLRRQWWIIPNDPSRTPQAYVDRVRLRSGGFGP